MTQTHLDLKFKFNVHIVFLFCNNTYYLILGKYLI